MIKFIIRIYPDVIAVLCGLLIIPWILGVPGRPTPAQLSGWNIGFFAICTYLLLYQTIKSLRNFEFYKKKISIHRPVSNILICAALFIPPLMVASFLLLVYS